MAIPETQLGLSLRGVPRWGGARLGAGRKRHRGKDRRVPHLTRARFKRLPAHVTLRVRSDVPSLRTVPIVAEIERTFAAGCERPGFRLVHYSLQGNHAHLIVEAQDRDMLGRGMNAISARLARAVNRATGRTGRVLVERYHHRTLATPREVHRALRYVLLNARRHAGRKATATRTRPRLDPASSARWFDGWRPGTVAADDERYGPPAVTPPRYWLVTVGWRRHGLLDPADVPGPNPEVEG